MPSHLITLQDFHENNFPIRVTTDKNSNVLDIEIALSPKQRYDFISQFSLKDSHWSQMSYGLLVRNALAKYNHSMHESPIELNADAIKVFTTLLWDCVGDFSPLEAMINRLAQDLDGKNFDSIDATMFLKTLVDDSYRNLTERITFYQRTITKETPKISALLTKLEQLKKAYTANFYNMLLTNHQVGKLFSMQNNSDSIIALGDYVASQLLALITFSVQHAYALTGGKHSRQLLSLNRLTKILSDVSAEIDEKSCSLHAVRVANNRTPIPMAQIALSENLSEQERESAVVKWLSIVPYVSGFDRLEDTDKIICYLLGLNYHDHLTTASLGRNGVLLASSMTEGALALIFRTLWFLGTSPAAVNADYAQKVDRWISDTHHKISPVRKAKQWVENAYQRAQLSIGHERLLDFLRDKSTSYYEQQFSHRLTAKNIRSFVKTMSAGLYRSGHDWYYMGLLAFSSFRAEALTSLISDVNDQYQLLKDTIKGEVALANGQERKEAEAQDLLVPEAGVSARWGTYQAWPANEYVGLLDFLDTIAVGLANLINAMFRNEPGPATLSFILANMSFFSVEWPSVLGEIGLANAAEPLADFTNLISTSFTGADVAEGLTKKLVAAFLEWKLTFFASVGLLETYQKISGGGGFEFIAEVFGNPEKLTLGLMILITSGWSLALIPPIDTVANISGVSVTNYYAAIINFFSNEARSCSEGIVGLNFIEYSFLGLKSWLFLAALLTGDPRVQLQSLVIKDFCTELKTLNVLNLDLIAAEEAVSNLLHQFGVYNEAVVVKIIAEIKSMRTPQSQLEAQRAQGVLVVDRWLPHLLAFDKLTSLLQTVQKMTVIGYQFESQAHANKFYELLVKAYAQYNDRVSAYGLLNNRMDGRNVLASFYNRYCHQGDLTIVKMATLLPSFLGLFYLQPIPYALRGAMFLVAKASDSPYMQHKIKKAFAEDIAMVLQAIAVLSRPLYSAARAYSYLLRTLVGVLTYLPALLITSISKVRSGRTLTMDDYFDFLARIALHQFSVTGPLRSLYSAVTTLAGTTHEDLAHQCAVQLNSVNPRALPGDRPAPAIAPWASEQTLSTLMSVEALPAASRIAIVVEDADAPEEQAETRRKELGALYMEANTAICCSPIDREIKSLELLSQLTQRRALSAGDKATLVAHLDQNAPFALTNAGAVRRVSACEQVSTYLYRFFRKPVPTDVDTSVAPQALRPSAAAHAANPGLAQALLNSLPEEGGSTPNTHLSFVR